MEEARLIPGWRRGLRFCDECHSARDGDLFVTSTSLLRVREETTIACGIGSTVRGCARVRIDILATLFRSY